MSSSATGASGIRKAPHTIASWRPPGRRGFRTRGRPSSARGDGSLRRSDRRGTGRSLSSRPGDPTAPFRRGRAHRARSCPLSEHKPGRTSSRRRSRVAPRLVREGLVQRLLRRGVVVGQDAVEVRLVQGPVEDSPISTVKERDGLPETLQQAGVVEGVEDLAVARLDRIINDDAAEAEVAQDRAGFWTVIMVPPRSLLDNGSPVGLISLPETPREGLAGQIWVPTCVSLNESD